ncbi:complement C3-like [Phyllobates terribilis]|uniref:complement C3-like n=1 Tax=Phyllobates terribilis TaxID=111132 RepID=UPI003CCAA233
MGCRILSLILLCFLQESHGQPRCILITPSVLHMDTEETIMVSIEGQPFPSIDITVQDFPEKRFLLAKSVISGNKDNYFLGKAVIKISSRNFTKNPMKKQFVTIEAKTSMCSLEKHVLLSFHSGYIFIQTDKPIYTPGSKLLYRIFPVNYKLRPIHTTVIVEFQNPEGLIVKRDVFQPDPYGFISKSNDLSELASLGTWTLFARYDDSLENFTTNFEVKEYVLPSFEVTIKTVKNFMYLDDNTFSVTVNAQYIYGKPVSGKAFVLFKLKRGTEEKSLTESLRRIEISDGIGHADLLREDLIKGVNHPDDLLQQRLHVSVTVITDSGGDLVEAELGNIFIVKSPYKILFTRTPKYFKPGMPFDLTVIVTNPDGSPAKNIPVVAKPGAVGAITLSDGTARIFLNTGTNTNTLNINVKTNVTGLQHVRQGSETLSVEAYKASNGHQNYLHISITNSRLELGKQVFVHFNILNKNGEIQKQILQFTYLILSRGKIVKVGRQERLSGQSVVSMPLDITEDLLPSFRIVAYYSIGDEMVSDSIWLDVVDSCLGTLELTARETKAKPGEQIKFTLRADHNSSVGLVAVDKAVYVLSNKYKMTQSKVWNTVEKSDIGCSPGGGADNMRVFYDAGLAVQTNFRLGTEQRTDPSCEDGKNRRTRSTAELKEFRTMKASKYTDLEKQCCNDGMVTNPMGHSCERRARLIQEGDKCVKAFLDCCRSLKLRRKIHKEMQDDSLDKSENDDEYLPDAEITVRSYFPESWLWDVVTMKKVPDANGISTEVLNRFLKDSITTWEVLAISLSETKGICVAQPYEIQAVKNFFIDLKLPYSVARNEQVEIRAIIYNYESRDLKVRISLSYNPQICSLSSRSRKYTKVVTVKQHSSFAVPFIIVPLAVGKHYVEVIASVYGELGGDGVRKLLKVVPEGIRKIETIQSVILDPEAKGRSGKHIVNITSLIIKNIVPQSEIAIKIMVQGSPISQLIQSAINGSKLDHLLITMPDGCAEQNMQRMTPVVIATHYLDKTNQWDTVGLERREMALRNIRSGYTTQLKYHRPDGSYGAFKNSVPSTWLTAYIAKVFASANALTGVVDRNILCGSIKWLILNTQQPDGLFQEKAPISAQYITGGLYNSSDPDVAITAFVLIALLESQEFCTGQVDNLQSSINKAVWFLLDQYHRLVRPHSIAITSYALALAGILQSSTKLLSAATDKSHWDEPDCKYISLEATSYALLTLLHLKNYDLVDPVAYWLTEQRFYGARYASTQATIMFFQSLAQYQVARPDSKMLDIAVSYKLPGRTSSTKYQFNPENALYARSDETFINEGFQVKAEGKGQATLTVMAAYYEFVTEKENECNNFDLSVTVKDEPNVQSPDGALGTVSITICFRHLKPVDATMSILDVSMMTGFSPDIEDLKKIKEGVDRYISDFEMNKGEHDKGTLIIYLDKVSHTEEECLKVNAHQFFSVGLIQLASVSIYDYYTPESRCTKFYHKDEGDKLLSTLCQGDMCRCALGNCLMAQQTGENFSAKDRFYKACEAGMDHAFKVTLLEAQYGKDYDRYVMYISQVFKTGTDAAAQGNRRDFISHKKCRETLKLKEGLDYLIFGKSRDLWQSDTLSYSYVIGSDTWIEWWPNDRQCQEPEYEDLCEIFHTVSEELEMFGCPD